MTTFFRWGIAIVAGLALGYAPLCAAACACLPETASQTCHAPTTAAPKSGCCMGEPAPSKVPAPPTSHGKCENCFSSVGEIHLAAASLTKAASSSSGKYIPALAPAFYATVSPAAPMACARAGDSPPSKSLSIVLCRFRC